MDRALQIHSSTQELIDEGIKRTNGEVEVYWRRAQKEKDTVGMWKLCKSAKIARLTEFGGRTWNFKKVQRQQERKLPVSQFLPN